MLINYKLGVVTINALDIFCYITKMTHFRSCLIRRETVIILGLKAWNKPVFSLLCLGPMGCDKKASKESWCDPSVIEFGEFMEIKPVCHYIDDQKACNGDTSEDWTTSLNGDYCSLDDRRDEHN